MGSITSLSDETGNIAQTYKYDSFGNITSQTGTIDQPFTYTAREFDSESGLYYYRARYYDTSVGRFISKDQIGLVPFGLEIGINHSYVYVGNNPVNFTDPLGLVKTQEKGSPIICDLERMQCELKCAHCIEKQGKDIPACGQWCKTQGLKCVAEGKFDSDNPFCEDPCPDDPGCL